jgi:hypothetical protein
MFSCWVNTHLPQEDAATFQQGTRCWPPRAAVADVFNNDKAQHQQQLKALHDVLHSKKAGVHPGQTMPFCYSVLLA